LLLAVIAGCNPVGPDYSEPLTEMPDVWRQKAVRGLDSGEADLQTWWELFNDPVLNELITRSASGNLALAQAWQRIAQARADVSFATGELYPQVDAVGDYQRLRLSDDNTFSADKRANPGNINLHNFGLDSVWEVDVFGRIRRSVESSEGALGASVEDYRDVLVSLYAEVAFNYIELRALQLRIELADSNIDLQEKTLKLTQDLFKAGIVPQLDVQQANLNLATTESAIPPLRFGKVAAKNRLAVLLGVMPGEVDELLLKEYTLPKLPGKVVVDLPVELLRQRPDIRRAERELAAQTPLIGAATAELYPI
jgi:multidrug efflux system outer membrane protein